MLLQAQHISKSFGATQALKDVHISLEAGKVHALVGENGAGKSTLFKICAGAIQKDAGSMTLRNAPYQPSNLTEAQRLGVALVFQEITINFALDIAENIYINRLHEFAGVTGLTRWKKLRLAAQRILDQIGADISVTQSLSSLDLGQLKVLEIARALSFNPQVLFLDETTAFLNTQEMDALFRVITNLKQQGLAVGYISHHLDEVEKVADQITVLKDGNWVGTFQTGELTREQIEAQMVGREIGRHIYPESSTKRNGRPVVLKMEAVAVPGKLHPVDLTLHQGEILGIGGLKGAGGETIMSVITGDNGEWVGRMFFEGRPYAPRLPAEAWEHGIAYLPGDRTGEGLIVDFSVRENLSMAVMPSRGPIVDRATEKQLADELIASLQIKAASATVACNSLSGGNLQKVVLGKCMAPAPKLLLLNNPTRGIDVGARMQIYNIVRNLADSGMSVMLLSEDLAELIGMSDRIIIMRKGKVSKLFTHDEKPSEEEIIGYMI